jgi:hypothetical protein
MTAVWIVLPVVCSLGVADRPEMVDVPLLYGIASLVVRSDSIEVTKDGSLPRGLDLRTKGGSVSKATIKVDESFDVTDGHHLGYSFKLLSIDKGMATLEMVFWTAFLGAEPTRSTSTTQVRSYVTRRKKE